MGKPYIRHYQPLDDQDFQVSRTKYIQHKLELLPQEQREKILAITSQFERLIPHMGKLGALELTFMLCTFYNQNLVEDLLPMTFRPITKGHGELFSVGQFVQDCKDGRFNNFDGSGYFCDGFEYSWTDICFPSELIKGNLPDKHFSHVIWFNK